MSAVATVVAVDCDAGRAAVCSYVGRRVRATAVAGRRRSRRRRSSARGRARHLARWQQRRAQTGEPAQAQWRRRETASDRPGARAFAARRRRRQRRDVAQHEQRQPRPEPASQHSRQHRVAIAVDQREARALGRARRAEMANGSAGDQQRGVPRGSQPAGEVGVLVVGVEARIEDAASTRDRVERRQTIDSGGGGHAEHLAILARRVARRPAVEELHRLPSIVPAQTAAVDARRRRRRRGSRPAPPRREERARAPRPAARARARPPRRRR